MKTKMFFLAGICAALAACSSDSDEVSSSPSNAPAILEVVSYKFVQEETDVVEWIEGEVQVLQHVENNKSTPLPMEYKSEERYKDSQLYTLMYQTKYLILYYQLQGKIKPTYLRNRSVLK